MLGVEPNQQKRLTKLAATAEQATTYELIATEFLEKETRRGQSRLTLSKLDWLIGIAKPSLGARPTTAISAPEVLKVLRGVEARERRVSAKHLRVVIGSVFR